MLRFPFSMTLVASGLLLLFLSGANRAHAFDELSIRPDLVIAPGIQTASAAEIAAHSVPALNAEPGREPDAVSQAAPQNSATSTSAQRLNENKARAMLAALMALASSGGGRPFPLLPH